MKKQVYASESQRFHQFAALSLVWKVFLGAMVCAFLLEGCSGDRSRQEQKPAVQNEEPTAGNENPEGPAADNGDLEGPTVDNENSEEINLEIEKKEEIVEEDWSEYFNGLNGAAVVYDVFNMQYLIFNPELAMTQRSPCSTFKIISSLIALENGIIEPEHAVRTWSGEEFWNENWNHDIGFEEAFRVSCVWYFRQVIDEIGQNVMQEELEKLQYGNCDISDWEGRLNTNNNNRALTGFWVESSLKISPKEQTQVMERIFGEESAYSEETRNYLRNVMLLEEQEDAGIPIYGKTGMGKAEGIVVDAWFTGFAEKEEGNIYFCVYLGRTDEKDVSSAVAKEIAVQIVSDYCQK